jgi:hypothetical protein
MMNDEIYEELEIEFERHRIDEDVEEVLLDLAEALADHGVMDQEVSLVQAYGKTPITVWGRCEEEDEEVNVFINRISIGKKKFVIEDYFL